MTISTSQSSEVFLGNGATNTFDFNFIGVSSSDLSVSYTDIDGNVIILNPSQYTIFLNPAAPGTLWGIGGTVTYPTAGSPIANDTMLVVSRTLPFTQVIPISNQGNFYPQVVERALDTLEMQLQQIAGRTGAFRGIWATGILYNFGDYVIDGAIGTNTGNYYMCVITNTSGVWATDLAAGDWTIVIDVATLEALVAAAAASASSAATSETNASNSASSASSSANTATLQANISTTQANNSSNSAISAAASAAIAANYAASLSSTSTTSATIGTGAQTFVTQSGKQYSAGQFLVISSNASALNFMHGTVTSYSGTSLVMNITDIGGSGAHADWNISLSGTQGPTGPSGGGTVTSVSGTTNRIVVTNSTTTPIVDIGSLVVTTNTVNAYTAQQYIATQVITSSAGSIAWNLDTQSEARITMTENATLANPTNMKDGGTYGIEVNNTSYTLAYGSAYKFTSSGGIPVIPSGRSRLTFKSNGTIMDCVPALDFV